MAQDVFRKKSLERIKSPESLNDYLKVSNPGIWLLMIAVIFLLVGLVVWSVFGQIDTSLDAAVLVKDGEVTLLVSSRRADDIRPGMEIRVGDETVGTVTGFDAPDGDNVSVRTDAVLPDGVYTGSIILESVKPISFVLN